jgi:hypothetical protein
MRLGKGRVINQGLRKELTAAIRSGERDIVVRVRRHFEGEWRDELR